MASTTRTTSASYRFIAGLIRPFLRLISKRTWYGVENLDRSEGFIVAANHVSTLDPLTTAHVLYNNGAPPRIMAKAELFKVPIFGALLRSSGQIPVHRNSRNAAESLDGARAALAAGECVMIFPEGTLTLDPEGWPMVARTGVARLALSTRAPVLPLAQWGASAILPRQSFVLRLFPRKRVLAIVGPPVELSDLHGRQDSAALVEATARIMAAITSQLAELRGEEPPTEPFDRRRAGV
ncbi:1-acyl-sn-glycerol-3-phosphate acyltransferase [Serinibacter arcticus]|uniref:1-acyl-sn-glycerol-3-phosphate acyltransferase n=1 Tax=Serinibacter arcticus TaxID=1655435 RepID=A0A2U1ZQX7_9MICO|nr:lysophospholipid acyltransferase family protein [Serinibacter arcticus]PWD49399.1 1-acyl-sn-glycerol-3-phosphate acyltransferase [Serinibacter arcticus]